MVSAADARRSLPAILAGGLTVAAALAIIGTYSIYSGTFDEPPHVAAGMELLDRGHYTYEPLHPPLARIAVALGPWLAGVKSTGAESMWREGRNVLYQDGHYTRNLSLARVGILPFFLLSALVVWLWTRRLSGDWAAAGAVGLLVTTQPVLAHAGLATLDMASSATIVTALLAFSLWLERASVSRSVVLGIATAAALLPKFSAVVFLPAGAAVLLGVWWFQEPKTRTTPSPKAVALVTASAALATWAIYGFSFGPVTTDIPVPAPEFWRGLGEVLDHKRTGWEGYLFGNLSTTGWWYFFPVAILVKTPIPFLILALAGVVAAIRRPACLGPIAAAGAILLVGMRLAPSIGLRQVLPVYPLLAIAAGVGALALWRSARFATGARAMTTILLAWQLVGTARAYPDFLPWFNALGGRHPENILVGSDLDWGQDLFRLADTVEARGVDSLALAYFGSADPTLHFRHVRPLAPHERPTGWVAVSVAVIKGLAVPGSKGFEWLDTIPPTAVAGTSIRLYHFAAP
ncbi:MAG: phospholipid carrier-dependent glycosyltransferase [Gemmatimonadetes bacterium]|nr:phospholipid carrier-dependent glycosyltransferase [Gemmatimonadota bacterium]